MVAAALCLFGWNRPGMAAEGPARTTRLFAALVGAVEPAWVATPEWKAVRELWGKLVDLEARMNRGGGQTSELETLQAKKREVAAGLDKLVSSSQITMATAEATVSILDKQLVHLRRMQATCYRAVSLDYQRRNKLQTRLALLEKLREGGKVDAWLYEQACKGLAEEVGAGPSAEAKLEGEVKTLAQKAGAEALLVERLFDEYRSTALAGDAGWGSLAKKCAPLFQGATAPEVGEKQTAEKGLQELVGKGLIRPVPAGFLAAVLSELAQHYRRLGPLAPTCYDMSQEGERKMQLRGKLGTLLKTLAKDQARLSDADWKAKFKEFSGYLFDLVAKPAKLAAEADDPSFLLDAAKTFDLLNDLAK
jgi:hypothetical protein